MISVDLLFTAFLFQAAFVQSFEGCLKAVGFAYDVIVSFLSWARKGATETPGGLSSEVPDFGRKGRFE